MRLKTVHLRGFMNFTIVFTVQAEGHKVLSYLTDMQLFYKAHPLISKIKILGSRSFVFYETIPIAGFKFHFSYPVIVKVQSKIMSVSLKSVILRLISVQMNFDIEEQHHRCVVHESVRIKSFLPVGFIMKRLITNHHQILFRNIETAIKTV